MQGPAQPRGTVFAEQAAIQYFVFSSLFNLWPQAKPCSEYRTGAFLTGFSTGSPRAVAGQFTSIFVVIHPHFPNWKLRNREIRISFSCPSEHFVKTPKDLFFWATLRVLITGPAGAPSGYAPPALPQSRSQGHILEKISMRNRQFGISHKKLAWKGLADWTPGSWQQPRVKKVLQSGIHCSICLPSNFCHEWAKVLQKPLPSLPSPHLTTSKGAVTHRSETKTDVCSLGEVP